MTIEFKQLNIYDENDNLVSSNMTQQGFEDQNRKKLADIFDLPQGEKVSLTLEESVVAFREPNCEEMIDKKEVTEKDKLICKALEYALNDLKDPSSSLYKDLYCQFFPEEKTKETFIRFGMTLIDQIFSVYGLRKTVANFFDGKEGAKITATILEESGKKAHHFEFFPDETMWKDPAAGFEKNEKYIYPVLNRGTMHDFDKEYVLSRIVPSFYASLAEKKSVSARAHDLFDYQMECRDVGKKSELKKIFKKLFR